MKSPSADRLDTKVLNEFLNHCRMQDISAQTMIIKVNDVSDRIYYLVEGSVEVIIQDETGNDMVLAYLNRGHFFGEIGFFSEQLTTRSAWVRARTDCVVAELTYPGFRDLAASNPSLIFELATQMATRLFSTDNKLSDLVFLDVTGRVARALMDLCEEPDAVPVPDGSCIRITQVQLSRIVGCSREMVIRVLQQLRCDGLIYNHEDGIVVRNKSSAAAVA